MNHPRHPVTASSESSGATVHDAAHTPATAHDHQAGTSHEGHDKHAGHDPEMFRRRFWLTLALTIPLVVTSHTVMDWFNYTVDLPLMACYGPVLGTIVSSGEAGHSSLVVSPRSATVCPG